MRIPAHEVILVAAYPGSTSIHNVLAGHVRAINRDTTSLAALVEIRLSDGNVLLARVTPDAVESLGLSVGREVVALVKSTSIDILPG